MLYRHYSIDRISRYINKEENIYIYRVTSESAALFYPQGGVEVQVTLHQKPCRAVFMSM